jgi:2-polyprenyl-6-methoxyphenol hydroxylase-like FAD-dependent oxidoreductase
MAPQRALIIGSGIAGPTAAIALKKAGIASMVYEAHSTSAEGIGTFLTLATNGVDALRTLGADEPAIADGFPTTEIVLWSGTGKRLGAAVASETLFTEDVVKIAGQQGRYAVGHGLSPLDILPAAALHRTLRAPVASF